MSILVIKDTDGTTALLEGGKMVPLVGPSSTERMGAIRVTDTDWAELVSQFPATP